MEHPYDVSRVVCKHTVQFFPPIITPGDRSVFPIPVNHIQYSSRNESADLLPKEELGRSVGYIMDEAACCTKMLEKGLESEGIVAWNTEVQDAVSVEKESGHSIEIKCINRIDQTERVVYADLLVLATGSDSPDLVRSLGFETPRMYNTVSAFFKVPDGRLERDMPMEYMYHRHPKISEEGPMAITRTNNYANVQMVSKKPPEELQAVMLRVLKKYDHIDGFFNHALVPPSNLKPEDLKLDKVGKSAISRFVKEGVALIGEAAGLVSEYYYEGTLGAFCSAQALAQIAKKISEEKGKYSLSALEEYEKKVRTSMLGNWEKSQVANEKLFIKSGESKFAIWDAYLKAMKNNSRVRKYVYNAWEDDQLYNYPLENDEYCGEQIYKNLPLSKKLALTPLFLKLKFS